MDLNKKETWLELLHLPARIRAEIWDFARTSNEYQTSSYKMKKRFGSYFKKETGSSSLNAQIQNEDNQILFYHDKEYPIQLKEISFAPPILFYRGNLSLLHSDIIGIVGSHAMRPYGRAVTRLFVNGLYGTSFNLMSGSLHGIEELTLRIALQCGGRIICVLTTGIDQVFPRCNQQLVNQVSESGLIISEYTPETVFQRKNLEERSRLISGIARGILIPEAAKQSSSLRTVYYGVEQNREIFAVPGNIFSEESGGANALIAEGAQMVTKPKEIVESFKF